MTSMERLSTACAAAILGGTMLSAAPAPQEAGTLRQPVDVARLGPQIGERVPDFNLIDQTGTNRTLRSIIGPNGAMLVFFRSADW